MTDARPGHSFLLVFGESNTFFHYSAGANRTLAQTKDVSARCIFSYSILDNFLCWTGGRIAVSSSESASDAKSKDFEFKRLILQNHGP